MNFFAISIPRASARYAYIQQHLKDVLGHGYDIVGVDGQEIREPNTGLATMSSAEIGCALSHVEACRRIVETGESWGVVMEDDVALPPNFREIVNSIVPHMAQGEVISLHARGVSTVQFSARDVTQCETGKLHYPMNWGATQGAAAYLIDRNAAKGISNYNSNVRCRADHWWEFYKEGAISSVRAFLPAPVKLIPFDSTLNYKASGNIDKFLYQFKEWKAIVLARRIRRLLRLRKQERNISLTDKSSPLVRDMRSTKKPHEK